MRDRRDVRTGKVPAYADRTNRQTWIVFLIEDEARGADVGVERAQISVLMAVEIQWLRTNCSPPAKSP